MSGECKSMGLLLGAHLDGQLDPVKTLEVEDHVAACEVCRERLALDRALRGSLKKAVKVAAPEDVRARMLAAMAGESARETSREENDDLLVHSTLITDRIVGSASEGLDASADRTSAPGNAAKRPSMLRHWRTMLPLASAAALVMAWGAAGKQPVIHGVADTMVPAGLSDDLLRDFVGQHSHSLPPEQADPKQVRQFERYVGVPVRVPQFSNASFVGGRLVPLHGGDRTAAMLQYQIKQGSQTGQRVTIFVYNPRNIHVGGANLAPRAIGTAEVRVGQTDGYSVALTERGGVGYAMASDLDPDSSANLVSAVEREQ